nr:hypothetical protein [Borreliella garinii]
MNTKLSTISTVSLSYGHFFIHTKTVALFLNNLYKIFFIKIEAK